MKKEEPTDKKEQFNARIPLPLKRATDVVAAAIGMQIQEMAEVALKSVMGCRKPDILAKRKQIEETAKTLNLSFDQSVAHSDGLEQAA